MNSDTPIEQSWQEALATEYTKPYFRSLQTAVHNARQKTIVYPPPECTYRALELCPLPTVKVVILGQDPYHGPGQAHGLAFSVPDDIPAPPSLINIYKEITADIGSCPETGGNLERWAKQGVLLLNTTLTVEAGSPTTHSGFGWDRFTDSIITTINQQRTGVVFMLWGAHARSKQALINHNRHYVLEASHPSPLSAHRGFFGCRHFSRANQYLAAAGTTPILWC